MSVRGAAGPKSPTRRPLCGCGCRGGGGIAPRRRGGARRPWRLDEARGSRVTSHGRMPPARLTRRDGGGSQHPAVPSLRPSWGRAGRGGQCVGTSPRSSRPCAGAAWAPIRSASSCPCPAMSARLHRVPPGGPDSSGTDPVGHRRRPSIGDAACERQIVRC